MPVMQALQRLDCTNASTFHNEGDEARNRRAGIGFRGRVIFTENANIFYLVIAVIQPHGETLFAPRHWAKVFRPAFQCVYCHLVISEVMSVYPGPLLHLVHM